LFFKYYFLELAGFVSEKLSYFVLGPSLPFKNSADAAHGINESIRVYPKTEDGHKNK